ncbi:ABC transporter substrate-binding protein [Actinacidiphila sp. ITFR-21]|uniref:ABC transporter substrate-binding protein n=1 Tax=Actinacidiphila sp. ITFR-21 TaxID=3075199 RepID=UPI00288B1D5F|nr:ABC transporter substrate-binding protein [Streptomyces sp. ITFR-21]WNI15951.1 ABC transporter substrate-binding protein [Streptomyces sp. ITFR-21]
MTDRRVRRTRMAAVAITAVSALLSGCGVLPGSAGGSPAPVVVMTWAPVDTKATNMPGMLAMAEVAEKYLNAQGGLNGRKVEVLTCNERDDPVAVTDCARQAADAGAVAVVGSYSEQGSAFTSALESSGIPYIGGYGITEDEFQSLLSYPLNGGLPALLAGSGRQLADLCEKVTLIRPDSITGDQFPLFLDTGLNVGGLADARDIPTADDSSDYIAVAAQAVGDNKLSSCVSAVLGDHTGTFFDALRRTGDSRPKVQLSSVIGSVQQSVVDSTGGPESPLEHTSITSWYPPASDPRWDRMKAAVNKYAFGDDRIDLADPGAQTTWIAYQVLARVVRAMGPGTRVDAEGVQRAMDRTTHLSTGGLTPDLGWTDDDMKSVPEHARMVNTEVTYQRIVNGRLVSARPGFVDLTATLRTRRSGY